MKWGKQYWFCNACGKRCYRTCQGMLGRDLKCCSADCLREARLREADSILGNDAEKKCLEPDNFSSSGCVDAECPIHGNDS